MPTLAGLLAEMLRRQKIQFYWIPVFALNHDVPQSGGPFWDPFATNVKVRVGVSATEFACPTGGSFSTIVVKEAMSEKNILGAEASSRRRAGTPR